jgi:sialic acid synthase SpsE
VQLTASVFGIAEAQMAKDAGLTTIKVGGGDSHRSELVVWCAQNFRAVWISQGLVGDGLGLRYADGIVPFYGVSQYPVPAVRNYAALIQADKTGSWGWTDHQSDQSTAFAALLYGPRYLERHVCLPERSRRQEWDSTPEQFRALRRHAEQIAWQGTPTHAEACAKFQSRWGTHGP